MTLTAFARRDFVGGGAVTTVTGTVQATDLTVPLTVATGWPTGANGKFFAVIDPGGPGPEER